MSCEDKVFEFYGGEDKTLEIQLKTIDSNGCKEIFPIVDATDTLEVTLFASPSDIIIPDASVTITSEPYGKISINLTAAQTETLVDGSAIVKHIRSGKVRIFVAQAKIRKLTIDNC